MSMRLFVPLLVVCLGGSVLAADRFVSPRGSDSGNDCSASSGPCLTIGRALTQAASGDVIKVAAGRYRENLVVDASTTLTLSGSWSSDFATRDAVPPRTILDGSGAVEANALSVTADTGEAMEVTLDGFRVTRAKRHNIELVATGDGSLTFHLAGSRLDKNIALSGFPYGYQGLNALAYDTSTLVLSVVDSTLTHHRNAWQGGALNVGSLDDASAVVSVVNSIFTGNRVYHSGGAIDLTSHSTVPLEAEITNSIIAKNRVDLYDGGGIMAGQGSSLHVVNSTITRNSAGPQTYPGGDGIWVSAFGSLVLTNTIVWGNRARPDSPSDVGPNPFTADHSDVEGLGAYPFVDLGGNVDVSPSFERGTYLRFDSPLIDAGTCTGAPPTDFEGDPRPTGPGCDIGADERAP
jgi:hypothetical protein